MEERREPAFQPSIVMPTPCTVRGELGHVGCQRTGPGLLGRRGVSPVVNKDTWQETAPNPQTPAVSKEKGGPTDGTINTRS